jgi:pilus assembly protein TadC
MPFLPMNSLSAGLGTVSGTGLLSAVFAGLAMFFALWHPASQLRRITGGRSRLAVVAVPVLRLIRGRPDASPLVRRMFLSGTCAAGLGLAVTGMNLSRGVTWSAVPVIAVAGTLMLGWLEPRSARRRRQQLIMEAPQALELLAACLAAGLPSSAACRAVVEAFDGPVADDLGRVLAMLKLGVGEVLAWRALRCHPQFGLPAEDLARAVESGTSMVEGLRHHARAAREARRGALQVRARAVGVRSVLPMMICFIPSFMLLGIVPAVVSAVFNAFG